jgi:hypothetical protein
VDNIGKQAVSEKLKTVRVVHLKDLAERRSQLADGVVTVEANINQEKPPSVSQIQQVLEKGL